MPPSLTGRAARTVAPHAGRIAPGPVARIVHRALALAISGVGPLHAASDTARAALEKADGDRGEAIDAIVATHLRLAAAQGFVTNLGGLVTLAASVPANVAGLALLQCRMVAAIAVVQGRDLDDDGVRNAVLACILGRDAVQRLVKKGDLPGTPRELADGEVDGGPGGGSAAAEPTGSEPGGLSDLDRVVAAQVATALISTALGRRLALVVGKRLPVVGGVVGAGGDYWATRRVAAYAREQLAGSTTEG